jgi:uncharacterized protein YndB with AHSA1/START domain
MPQATRTIVIARPQAEVFAFFAEAENDPQWRGSVTMIKRDGPLASGTHYTHRVAGPGGREIPADFEITEYEPDVKVVFRGVSGPVRPDGSYTFSAVEGGTSVTFSLSAELTGMRKVLMGKPVQKAMDGEMASLDKAKTILESSTGAQ